MATQDGLTKKQLKELHRLEKLQSHNIEKKQTTVKWIAITVVSLLFLVFFIGLVIIGKNKNAPKTTDGKAQLATTLGHSRIGNLEDSELSSQSAKPNQNIVTIVEYGDFQCPACKAFHPLIKSLHELYPENLKVTFKHFPLTAIHKNAIPAAIAAEAAGQQNKFFKFADILYEKQDEWAGLGNPQDNFLSYAREIGLDIEKFEKDQKDGEVKKKVDDDNNEGIKNGVNGTPTFFVNGERIENPADLKAFQKIIDGKLNVGPKTEVPTSAPKTNTLDL